VTGQHGPTASRMEAFRAAASRRHGRPLGGYEDLWRWSVEDLGGFWSEVACQAGLDLGDGTPLLDLPMPDAQWFPGARVNLAREVFAQATPERPALVALDETGVVATWSWQRLEQETGALAAWLRAVGVGPGDRVVGYLGNRAETVVAFLACASLGATWSG
jgi:acetoacetyl-CoA synthetase